MFPFLDEETETGTRHITYEIAKNKGLMPSRKKEQRNPRVKYRNKYQDKLKRRKGQVNRTPNPLKNLDTKDLFLGSWCADRNETIFWRSHRYQEESRQKYQAQIKMTFFYVFLIFLKLAL